MSEQVEKRPSREWVKFGILVVVFLGVILVVSWARPFIFEQVIPVVMGEGQPSVPVPDDVEPPSPAEEETPPEVEEETTEESAPVEDVEPTTEVEGMEEEEEVPEATAVPPLTHIVQPGESIIQIAENYNITVDAIVAANNISNPNHIEAGVSLVIPQP